MAQIDNRIVDIKHRYDIARTSVAVAESKEKECVKQMKKLGITPKTRKKKIKELRKEVEESETQLNKMLDGIDERIGKNN